MDRKPAFGSLWETGGVTYPTQPHISAALRHLRFGVTTAAGVLALSLLAQVILWCFVHYTDVRQTRLGPPENEAREAIVVKSESAKKPADDGAKSAKSAKPAPEPVARTSEDAADVNNVPGTNDALMRAAGSVIQTAGIISALLLVLLVFQCVAVAGGGNIPGVEMMVTAATWAIVVALLAVPLNGLIPSMTFPGVLAPYSAIADVTDSFRAGGDAAPGAFTYYSRFIGLPMLMVLGLVTLVLRFRAGLEAGIIATSVSQLDEKLEREIRAMKLGQISAPRAVGALNQAIGMQPLHDAATGMPVMQHPQAMAMMPAMPPSVPPGYVPQAAVQQQPVQMMPQQPMMQPVPVAPPPARSMSGQTPGEPLRRPI